ncbi:MAG: hypothetical protein JWM87_1078, partial [Candidatus Eremiobacteraeota bacterium]|nr:hypothetical protein [Candidatus Eremiobacteraeota bacterium]
RSPHRAGASTNGDRTSSARGERAQHQRGAHAADARAQGAADERSGRAAACTQAVPQRHGEHRIAGRAPRHGAASFTIQAAGGRVHLVVRSDGERTRVVAVCAPSLRERVERALAHVRFVLVGGGVRAEVAS